MGKSYYVKFETPEELVAPILEAVRVASTSGKVKKGTNEAYRFTVKMVAGRSETRDVSLPAI